MPKKRQVEVEEEGIAMGRDPFASDEEVLARTIFGAPSGVPSAPGASPAPARHKRPATRRRPKKAPAPAHYKIVSISLYMEDIERIDALVSQLKESGHPKANRSALIRYAIDTVDISQMPRSY